MMKQSKDKRRGIPWLYGPKAQAINNQPKAPQKVRPGFSFVRCKRTGFGVVTSILGRPCCPYSCVVFGLSYMSSAVSPQGMERLVRPPQAEDIVYGQY
ncbi:probable pectinesterase 53 [Brachypodium distachyon]|uniref:probable pectinesterase 53 n=1 Tax=Brachypodium distachyon TaxID=15368 RepID=UPI000D0DBCCE|nr:probable pectinesterase 53 [Brachypodium distachyon]|eukprot:XP_024313929.1 probable pectinesterase 53 [Brachypodium distachyon]